VNYAVIGYGNIGRKRHRLLRERSVATVDPYDSEATYRKVHDLPLAAIDAVVLSVPDAVKLEFLEHFLRAGKHVLVEKPLFFADRAAADRMAAVARDAGAIWYTSYNARYEPLVQRLRLLLRDNAIGALYSARLVYGNGTVANFAGTWREESGGVLTDLGCHLVDLARELFGYDGPYAAWDLRSLESATIDYALLASADRRIVLEAANVMWRNRFAIDAYGEEGSVHLRGLLKWGPTTLTSRQRVRPSGRPVETVEEAAGDDVTWAADLAEFERRAAAGITSIDTDWVVSQALVPLLEEARDRGAVKALRVMGPV
jgi:predicted dehydrogenase